MALNETSVAADAATVWSILADPGSYSGWVVGSRDMRGVEGPWPRPGSLFHHSQGFGPLVISRDTTAVIECEEGRRLLLEVRARPWIVAHVEIVLEPEGDGTRVVMAEHPVGGLVKPARPVVDKLIQGRNVESLRRLRDEAERRGAGSRPAPAARGAERARTSA